jgi:Gpi18-like mannosyltransferase
MKKTLLIVALWLLVINIFALTAFQRFNLAPDTAYSWISPTTLADKSWNMISLHARWDSFYYLDIAQHGYHLDPGNALSNVVFFPLYPVFIRLGALLTGRDYILAGWLVSMLALFGASLVLRKLIEEFHPEIKADDALFYLLIFPTAFFLQAVYSESLFLFLSLLTFYFALQGRFNRAGIFGLLAALTRVTGVLLFVPVAYEYFKIYNARGFFKKEVLPLLLIPAGTALFFLYHAIAFGDPLIFFKVESAWGRAFQFNGAHFALQSGPALVNFSLDAGFLLFALYATYLTFRKGWTAYALYMSATLLVALSTGTLMSLGRYVLVLFPVYILLASIKNKSFERFYPLASVLFLGLYILLFSSGYWAG